MKNLITKTILILFCLYSAFFFVGSTLAPIFAHYQLYEPSAQLTATFMFSCHQEPDRSFWLLGYPVALCCRCYGVYLGCVISSIIAIFNKLHLSKKSFIILSSICIIDIIINYGFGIRTHNTGNIVRFVVGIITGLLITTVINYILLRLTRKEEKDEN